jgi:arylsulfatase A-like enzyme
MPPGKNHVLWTDLNTGAVEELLAKHDRKQPLFLIVASHSPHVYWPETTEYQSADVKLTPDLLDTPETRAMRCRYYGDVTHMDAQLGAVRTSLAKHGFGDALLIYTADQGAQWPFAKWNLYEAGIRVPLIVSWRGKVKPSSSTRAMVSLIDLLPTLLEIAGGKPDRKSFTPVLLGKSDAYRHMVFAAHTGDGNMNRSPMRCIRTAQYKYILNLKPDDRFKTHISDGTEPDGKGYWQSWLNLAKSDPHAAALIQRFSHRPAEELYDIVEDPYEQHNLAADPSHGATLTELREKLKQWRIAQGEDLTKVPMPEDARQGEIPYAN